MKYLSIIILAVIGFFALQSCGSKTCDKPKAEDTVNVNKEPVLADATAELSLEGMVCSKGCVSTIEKGLNAMTGVASSKVDYETKTVKVSYDSKIVDGNGLVAEVASLHDGQYSAELVSEEIETIVEEIETVVDEVEAVVEGTESAE